jgi:hypothetical protein
VGYRWSRRFNRSEILKSPAKKSGNIIFVFGFRCKQIVARDHRASEQCHTLIIALAAILARQQFDRHSGRIL